MIEAIGQCSHLGTKDKDVCLSLEARLAYHSLHSDSKRGPAMRHTKIAIMVAALFLAGSKVVLAGQSDEDFIKTAIGINLAEIQTGQLAQKNGSTAGVREFGAMLVRDHTASNQEAVALAEKHNVTAPNAPSDEDQKMYQDLTGKREVEFNKTFLQDMVDGHQKAVKLFTDESSSASGD